MKLESESGPSSSPTPGRAKGPSLERRIFSGSRERVALAGALAFLQVLSVTALIAAALLFGSTLQQTVINHRIRAATGYAIWFTGVLAIRMLLSKLTSHLGNRLGLSLSSSISNDLVHASTEVPVAGVEIAYLAIDGADSMLPYASRFIPAAIAAAIVTPVLLVFTLATIPIAFAEMVLGLAALPVLMIVIGKATKSKADEALDATIHINTLYLDTLAGIAVLKAFAKARLQRDAIAKAAEALKLRTMTVLRTAFASGVSLDLLVAVIVALVAVSIGIRLNDDSLSLANGAAVLFITPEVFAPIRIAALQYHATQDARAVADRITRATTPTSTQRNHQVTHTLCASNNSANKPLLELVDFAVLLPGGAITTPLTVTARAGQLIAVTGPSGAGKTAWLDGLAGINPTTGSIYLPGRADQQHFEHNALSYLPAEPAFTSGTILDNICLFNGPPDLDYLEQVARLLGGQAIMNRLDEQLLPAAINLSSGERQKLGLIRAFAFRPDFVLLDEPSAHLDTASTCRLAGGLQSLANDAAIIFATHSRVLQEAAAIKISLVKESS